MKRKKSQWRILLALFGLRYLSSRALVRALRGPLKPSARLNSVELRTWCLAICTLGECIATIVSIIPFRSNSKHSEIVLLGHVPRHNGVLTFSNAYPKQLRALLGADPVAPSCGLGANDSSPANSLCFKKCRPCSNKLPGVSISYIDHSLERAFTDSALLFKRARDESWPPP